MHGESAPGCAHHTLPHCMPTTRNAHRRVQIGASRPMLHATPTHSFPQLHTQQVASASSCCLCAGRRLAPRCSLRSHPTQQGTWQALWGLSQQQGPSLALRHTGALTPRCSLQSTSTSSCQGCWGTSSAGCPLHAACRGCILILTRSGISGCIAACQEQGASLIRVQSPAAGV